MTTNDLRYSKLCRIRIQAKNIHEELTEMDIRSGAVGAARTLVEKIDRHLRMMESDEDWTHEERLACNAWRVHMFATRVGSNMPTMNDWKKLPEHEQNRWREAALVFQSKGKE